MKTALITASPKGINSASKCLLDMLKKQLENMELEEFVWNRMSCSGDDMEKIGACDAIVFAFPLYIDSIPSHLLRCLIQLQEYLSSIGAGTDVHVYAIVNNGFFDSKQDIPAIDVMKNWAVRAGISFGQGIAVGGGGMITGIKNLSDEHGPKKNIYMILGELAKNIKSRKTAETKTVLPGIPEIVYKLIAQTGWRNIAKKNGLRMSDLGKRS